jgi:FkbM family methyltransferase
LAVLLRLLVLMGFQYRAGTVAYRSRARRLARDARVRLRRWGVWFELNLNDNVQRMFYYTGWYEPAFLQFLNRELDRSDTYVDVGAHVGIDAAFAARRVPQGMVVAFEPVPESFSRLRDSFAGWGNVQVIEAALGEDAGRVTLRANPKWHPDDAATRSRFATGPVVCDAEVLRFDEWAVSLDRMDVVKIDVEGSEFDVLKGMTESLRRLRPRVVAVELYAPYLRAAGTSEDEITEHLNALGYRREQTIGDNAIFRHEEHAHASATRPQAVRRARVRGGALRPALWPAGVSVLAFMVWFARAVILRGYNPVTQPLSVHVSWLLLVVLGCLVGWFAGVVALLVRGRIEHARAVAGFVPDSLLLLTRLLRDPRLRRRHRLALLFLAGYVAMPLDAIPDIIPIVGQLDEIFLFVVIFRWIVRSSGESVVRAHWPGPESSLQLLLRVASDKRPARG